MLASCGLLLLLDQWSKAILATHGKERRIPWLPILRLRRVDAVKPFYRSVFARAFMVAAWLATFVAVVFLHESGTGFQSPMELAGIGVALGGAAGNLLDILRRHYVIDFIEVRRWPVFNLADLAIVGGVLAAFWTRL
jgi:signal peptidase II